MNGTPGKLVGACLSRPAGRRPVDDLQLLRRRPGIARKGLGTYIILDHIIRASRAGLPYVYLGYWVEGSPRMAYKTRFRPLERLGRDGWRRMDDAEADAAAEATLPEHEPADPRRAQAAVDQRLVESLEPRPLSPWLVIGVLSAPIVFVGFSRPGYRGTLRLEDF